MPYICKEAAEVNIYNVHYMQHVHTAALLGGLFLECFVLQAGPMTSRASGRVGSNGHA